MIGFEDGLNITDELAEVLAADAKRTYWSTGFHFLRTHAGLRPGKLHLFLGPTHAGKSTIVRSIVADIARMNLGNPKFKKILIWLSEESRIDFLTEFIRVKTDKNMLSKFHVLSEQDDYIQKMKDRTITSTFMHEAQAADMVIFDNITTSQIYMDKNFDVQSTMAKLFKKVARVANVPIVLIAHTKAGINEGYKGLIENDDIRGSKTLPNLCEFLYTLQGIRMRERFYPTIRILKHRGQNVDHKLYVLNYDHKRGIYDFDTRMKFEDFKGLWKERDKLS